MGNVQNKGFRKTTQVITEKYYTWFGNDVYKQVYKEMHYIQQETKCQNDWVSYPFAEVYSGESSKWYPHQTAGNWKGGR